MINSVKRFSLGVSLALFWFIGGSAFADEASFWDGWWRIEGGFGAGTYSGLVSRSGDLMYTGTIEYEKPVLTDYGSRYTLGLRAMPLFIYDEESRNVSSPDGEGEVRGRGRRVWGGGLGLAGRIYSVAGEYRGFFIEAAANALIHKNRLEGNSSNLNFLTGGGLGYKFRNGLHIAAKYEHVSNAGIKGSNQSANIAGGAIGFSF